MGHRCNILQYWKAVLYLHQYFWHFHEWISAWSIIIVSFWQIWYSLVDESHHRINFRLTYVILGWCSTSIATISIIRHGLGRVRLYKFVNTNSCCECCVNNDKIRNRNIGNLQKRSSLGQVALYCMITIWNTDVQIKMIYNSIRGHHDMTYYNDDVVRWKVNIPVHIFLCNNNNNIYHKRSLPETHEKTNPLNYGHKTCGFEHADTTSMFLTVYIHIDILVQFYTLTGSFL